MRTTRLEEKIAKLKEEMGRLEGLDAERRETPDQQISLTDPDARSMTTPQGPDGRDALPDEEAKECAHRDGAQRLGL